MKRLSYWFLFISVALVTSFYACNKHTEDLLSEDIQTEEYLLSNAEAKLLLSEFIGSGALTRSGDVLEIGDYETLNYQIPIDTKSENVPVFKYTLQADDKEGYALVVADSRIPKVLIYAEEGSLSDTSFIEPLRLYTRTIPEYITNDLNRYYTGETKAAKPVTKAESVVTYYHFLPTVWGQAYPYNAGCPTSICSPPAYNGHYPAGCVAIAIAQILAYHHKPSSLSWSSILASTTLTANSSSTLINQVGTLIANIGAAVNMSYGCNGSGAYSADAYSVFSSYGLTSAVYQQFDVSVVASSLQSGYPVYMRGVTSNDDGHAWVCDGYKKHIYGGGDYYEYLNMNWGWDGTSNGFYYTESSPSYNTGSYTFNSSFKIYPNIH
jgi:hypothetical protein